MTTQEFPEVIMVDDDSLERDAFQRIYRRTHLTETLACYDSGWMLLENMQVFAEHGHMPRVIFCDSRMPKFSGEETVRKLREMPSFQKEPRFYIFSHTSDQREIASFIAAGATAFLTKPSDLKAFTSLIVTAVTGQLV